VATSPGVHQFYVRFKVLETTEQSKQKPNVLTSSEGESESIETYKREPNVLTLSEGESDSMAPPRDLSRDNLWGDPPGPPQVRRPQEKQGDHPGDPRDP
jgi:hypothetical protein